MRIWSISLALAAVALAAACSANAKKAAPAQARPAPPSAEGAFEKRLSDADLAARKKALPALAFDVTQKEATEPPFANAYWNNHSPGIYVDVVSGEPLFSSKDKFDSGTGWPSFTAPLEPANVVTHDDNTLGMSRTEVRSRIANSHLGHVFDDGPAPTHVRYCMDSASLKFIPAERLAAEGYGTYAKLFPEVAQQAAKR
jgi:methionine-R-sulfoxide reductase